MKSSIALVSSLTFSWPSVGEAPLGRLEAVAVVEDLGWAVEPFVGLKEEGALIDAAPVGVWKSVPLGIL